MGKPKQLYSDEESSFRATVFFRLIHESCIKHVQTSIHAPSAELFIRSFKYNLYRLLYGFKQDKSEWVKHVSSILTNTSNTEHNTTKIKPPDVVKKKSIDICKTMQNIQEIP